jgi:predicted Zn-dependent peptidase
VVLKTKSQTRTALPTFEHLLFEGTESIKRGEWFKIVTGNERTNNANTTDD